MLISIINRMSRRDSSARSGRSGSRDSQRSDRSSERTDPLAEVNPRHRVYRAMSAGPSAPPPLPSGYPRPTSHLFARPPLPDEGRAPDVRMPQMHRPATPVSDPPPDLFFPQLVPAIPETTPEGVPIPIPEDRPRFITPQEAYVYVPFGDMTLESARVCPKDKEESSSATSAAGKKNNV